MKTESDSVTEKRMSNDMNRRSMLARSITVCGATLLPAVSMKATEPAKESKEFKSSLKRAIIQESNMGFTQGVGFEFADEEFRYRRIALEIDQGCSPHELAPILREMANACEDPGHQMWVKGSAEIGNTTIKKRAPSGNHLDVTAQTPPSSGTENYG